MNDNKFWEIQQIIEQGFLSDIESIQDKKTLLSLCMQYVMNGKLLQNIPEEMQYQLVDTSDLARRWCEKQKITVPEILDYLLQLGFFATLMKIMKNPNEYHFSFEDFPDTLTVTWLTLQEKSFGETYKLLASQYSTILQKLLGDDVLNILRDRCEKMASWVDANDDFIDSCMLWATVIMLIITSCYYGIAETSEQKKDWVGILCICALIPAACLIGTKASAQNVENWKKHLLPIGLPFFTSPKLALPNNAEDLNIVDMPNHSRQI